jgi:uncharacterized membrane protein
MKGSEKIALLIVLISFIVGIYMYSMMPATMASHWDASGNVNGSMPRFWAVFLMPIISVVLFLMFMLIPKLDPMYQNIEKFRKHYDVFIIWIFLFMLYIYILTLLWNIGIRFSMTSLLAPAFGILFYTAGVLISKAKMNWSIGIRTPWTMSNEKVWDRTHHLGGYLFKLSGIIAFFGVFLPQIAIWLVLFPIIIAAIILFVYSYLEFKKEEGKSSKKKKRVV